jgi:hypothetical protein
LPCHCQSLLRYSLSFCPASVCLPVVGLFASSCLVCLVMSGGKVSYLYSAKTYSSFCKNYI